MAFDTPSMPPELAALFAARAAKAATSPAPAIANPTAAPSATPAPAAALGAPAPMRTIFGMPEGSGVFQRPKAALTPPSDDPAVSGGESEPTLPGLPDTSQITNEQKTVNDLRSQIGAIHKPTPEEYKPSLLRRILSVPIATAAGLHNPAGGALASDEILNGRYNRAEQQYQAKLSPLQQQLEYEQKINVPLAESQAKIAQAGFENQLNLAKEKRAQIADENETGDKIFEEAGPDGKPKYYQTTKSGKKLEVPEPREQAEDRRKREEDANTPAPGARPEPDPANKGQMRVKTKAGGYTAWTPKTIDEGAMFGYPGARGLYDEAHRDKAAEATNANGYTVSEQREISQRTRPMETRINALEKTRSLLVGSPDKEDKAQLAAIDQEIADNHQQITAVENEVVARRPKGGAAKGTAAGNGGNGGQGGNGGKAASTSNIIVPAQHTAKDKPDGANLKMGGKVIATAKGGKWIDNNGNVLKEASK